MGNATRGKMRLNGSLSINSQIDAIMDARTQHTVDREELMRMRDTTELRLWKLKRRMPVSPKRQGLQIFSMASGIYAETIQQYEALIPVLNDAIADHEKILLAARGIKPRSTLRGILKSFAKHIMKICAEWQYILEVWYKDAGNILLRIKENAEKLPQFSLAQV